MSPAQHLFDKELFAVMTCVVCKKMATISDVAEATGRRTQDIETSLATLEGEGAIYSADGRYFSTELGVEQMKAYADSHYSWLRNDDSMDDWHSKFDEVNRRFLKAMTDWQTVPLGPGRAANDHSDPEYDARVISRIAGLVENVQELIDQLEKKVPRFQRYSDRFDAAVFRIEDGDTRYVATPLLDSVHTIWFEFHEDLLLVLGKERTE